MGRGEGGLWNKHTNSYSSLTDVTSTIREHDNLISLVLFDVSAVVSSVLTHFEHWPFIFFFCICNCAVKFVFTHSKHWTSIVTFVPCFSANKLDRFVLLKALDISILILFDVFSLRSSC